MLSGNLSINSPRKISFARYSATNLSPNITFNFPGVTYLPQYSQWVVSEAKKE